MEKRLYVPGFASNEPEVDCAVLRRRFEAGLLPERDDRLVVFHANDRALTALQEVAVRAAKPPEEEKPSRLLVRH